MTKPALHVLERLRRRIPDLFSAEQYVDTIEDLRFEGDDLAEYPPTPNRPPRNDGDAHIGSPYSPEDDERLFIEILDHFIEADLHG